MYEAFDWTEEQQNALKARDQAIWIKAGPGAGKTSVFVKKAAQELRRTEAEGGAIAALSYTNAACDEVTSRLRNAGISAGYPHFFGTLDSFFQRFIVGPFATQTSLVHKDGVTVVPADCLHIFRRETVKIWSNGKPHTYPLCELDFRVNENGDRCFYYKKVGLLSAGHTKQIFADKKKWWKRSGILTHSDVQFLSALLLENAKTGSVIREVIARRFRCLLVDELQDTSKFAFDTLIALLRNTQSSSFLVGDSDQAIFQFSGACPELFNQLPANIDAKEYPLTITHRFGDHLATLARHLSVTSHPVTSSERVIEPGHTILLRHNLEPPVLARALVRWISESIPHNNKIAFLFRNTAHLQKLQNPVGGRDLGQDLASKQAKVLHNMSISFARGDWLDTFKKGESVLGGFLFNKHSLNQRDLDNYGVTLPKWRHTVWKFVQSVSVEQPGQTWSDWIELTKTAISTIASQFEISTSGLGHQLKKSPKGMMNTKRALAAYDQQFSWPQNVDEFLTVHNAKGREFETVVYIPKLNGHQTRCPSKTWTPKSSNEEKCIAYVAATRAKKTFVLCVHQKVYDRLNKVNPELVKHFVIEDLAIFLDDA